MIAPNGRGYGGVAFIYRKSRGIFREFLITNPRDYEFLTLIGKVKGIKSKIFFLICYAPPFMGNLAANGTIEYVLDLIAGAKRPFQDPFIVISGDCNQWPIQDFLSRTS